MPPRPSSSIGTPPAGNPASDETLRKAHDLLLATQKIGKLGSWQIDIRKDELSWSAEAFRIFGIEMTAAEMASHDLLLPVDAARRAQFLERMHPEDRAKVEKAYLDSIESHAAYSITHRLILPDSRVKVVLESCENYYADDGTPLRSLGTVLDITAQHEVQEALQVNERVLSGIFTNAATGICYADAKTGRQQFNARLCEMLGYTATELHQLDYHHFTDPEDSAKEDVLVADMRAGRLSRFHMDKRYIRKDGTRFWGHLGMSVVRSSDGELVGFVMVVEDITERRQAQEALEKFNLELEQRVAQRTAELTARTNEIEGLVNSIPDTVLICDREGRSLLCHPPRPEDRPAFIARCPGCDGGPCRNAMVQEIAHAVTGRALTERQTVVQELERQFEGHRLWVEVRATPIGADRILVLLREITARKQMEQEIRANLERERELSSLRSQFVSVASHEFRTPLTAAVGSVGLLENHGDRLSPAKRQELLDRIKLVHQRLIDIMDDMLVVTRAEAGRVSVEAVKADLVPLIQHVLREVDESDQHQHRLVLKCAVSAVVVHTDTRLLQHILVNLISNAVRYSPRHTTVTVTLEATAESFAITVSDEGIGIPESDRARIFDPFVRGSNVGQIRGTGLGLNIVKRYAELMGGHIRLLPTTVGAAFHLQLPAVPVARPNQVRSDN